MKEVLATLFHSLFWIWYSERFPLFERAKKQPIQSRRIRCQLLLVYGTLIAESFGFD